ncbi:MAG: DUF1611 domain-containing protein [Lewinellaceae bacterium]|nr:DUF1611 domain-containing protein [Lewinellaceae bacterium]
MNRALILTNGLLSTTDAKTAHGLIRGSERFTIAGVIDPPAAGQDAGVLLDGRHRDIPVFASLETALEQAGPVDHLIIGVATVGGILPADMLDDIRAAIRRGLSVVNGLHDYLTEKPELVALAQAHGVQLTDIRKPKPRSDLHFWTGAIHDVPCPVIAVIGTDCAVGKRTTARMLRQACTAAGINAQMIYTGQTGWLQGGSYGFIFDSTLNDFVTGELEHAILSCWNETRPDLILLEGQSALRNPSGPCGPELLISGNARQVILVHAPKRKYYDNEPHWGEIPPVESEIALIRQYGSQVLALALNTEDCTEAEAFDYQCQYELSLAIPVLLPIEQGVGPILPALQALLL